MNQRLASFDDEGLMTINQLNLAPLMGTDFADMLLDSSEPAEIDTALRYWQQFWPESPEVEHSTTDEPPLTETQRQAMRHQIRIYLTARDKLVDHNLRMQQTGNLSVSLDSTFNSAPDGLSLAATLSSRTCSPPAAKAEQLSLTRFLMNCLKTLAPKEKIVSTQRRALEDSVPLSRPEIADQLSVSNERIRQLEMSALGKLRNDQRGGGLMRFTA